MDKKNEMKMHCVSHVVKGTVYITIISDNNSFLPDFFNSIKGPQKKNSLKLYKAMHVCFHRICKDIYCELVVKYSVDNTFNYRF